MSNGGGQDNIYTEGNGEILIRFVEDTVDPTQGEVIVIVEVDTLPIT